MDVLLQRITDQKIGLEIGGPSCKGSILYNVAERIDNVNFNSVTVWSTHDTTYFFNPLKSPGKVIINDAVSLTSIEDEVYDFLFASHCYEHIANPIKSMLEWIRVIKNGGYIILILPEKSTCFDHKRSISSFETLKNQYSKNVAEDDLTSLPEILRNHDLSLDPPAGNFEQFTLRSLDNFNNRCLHHYVYSIDLLKEVIDYCTEISLENI